MYTVCPRCSLNLAVTASDLRVGQGYVRCGRCQRVFNALVSLADELPDDDGVKAVATGTVSLPTLADDGSVPDGSVPDGPVPDDAVPEEAARAGSQAPAREAVDERQVEERLRTIVERFDRVAGRGESVAGDSTAAQSQAAPAVIATVAAEPAAETASTPLPALPDVGAGPAAEAPGPAPQARGDDGDGASPDPLLDGPPPADTGRHARAYAWGSVALALLLAAQLVHRHRHDLAAHAGAAAVLGPIYRLAGSPLEPRWDVGAYTVRQLGAAVEAGNAGRITLRASIHNGASRPQPLPLLRVVLHDRFGNSIATRDVEPAEYRTGASLPAQLAADESLDAQVLLDDPGGRAAGFELDACLPAGTDRLYCGSLAQQAAR